MEIDIYIEIRKISTKYSNYEFYLFGSFTKRDGHYGDVDVLIIYDSFERINSVRFDFKNINTFENFDLMFLSIDEEKEMKFIEKVKAIRF